MSTLTWPMCTNITVSTTFHYKLKYTYQYRCVHKYMHQYNGIYSYMYQYHCLQLNVPICFFVYCKIVNITVTSVTSGNIIEPTITCTIIAVSTVICINMIMSTLTFFNIAVSTVICTDITVSIVTCSSTNVSAVTFTNVTVFKVTSTGGEQKVRPLALCLFNYNRYRNDSWWSITMMYF